MDRRRVTYPVQIRNRMVAMLLEAAVGGVVHIRDASGAVLWEGEIRADSYTPPLNGEADLSRAIAATILEDGDAASFAVRSVFGALLWEGTAGDDKGGDVFDLMLTNRRFSAGNTFELTSCVCGLAERGALLDSIRPAA